MLIGSSVTLTSTAQATGPATESASLMATVVAAPPNSVPVLASNAGAVVAEGGLVVITSAMLEATDADGDPLTYTVTSPPTAGNLSLGTSFTQAQINGGSLSYSQNGSEVISDSFTFTVSDGNGGSIGSTTFAITVTPVNEAPSLGLASLPAATEGVLYLVLISPTDPDTGDVLTVSLVAGPLWIDPPVDNGNGTWTLSGTPGPGDAGSRLVTLRVTDSGTPPLDEQLALPLLVHSSGVAVPARGFWRTWALVVLLAGFGARRAASQGALQERSRASRLG